TLFRFINKKVLCKTQLVLAEDEPNRGATSSLKRMTLHLISDTGLLDPISYPVNVGNTFIPTAFMKVRENSCKAIRFLVTYLDFTGPDSLMTLRAETYSSYAMSLLI